MRSHGRSIMGSIVNIDKALGDMRMKEILGT